MQLRHTVHLLNNQCRIELKAIAKHKAHGISPNMIRLASTPDASPKEEAATIAIMKIAVW
jgi:hypothetical protein